MYGCGGTLDKGKRLVLCGESVARARDDRVGCVRGKAVGSRAGRSILAARDDLWRPATVSWANQGTSFGGPSQVVGLDREHRLNCCQSRVGARNRLIFDKKILKRSKLWSLVAPRPGRVRESAEFYIQLKVSPCLDEKASEMRTRTPSRAENEANGVRTEKKNKRPLLYFRYSLCQKKKKISLPAAGGPCGASPLTSPSSIIIWALF